VPVRIGPGTAPPPPAPSAGTPAPSAGAAAVTGDVAPPMSSAPGGNFIRVVTDKTRAFVGEQVTVTWYLYLTQRIDKYDTITEPRTDSFWSEDMVSANARNRLSLTQ